MSTEAKSPEDRWHRKFAASLFNWTWTLLEKKDGTRGQDAEMVHAAHASRFHWGKVGTPVNFAQGEWQISRVYSVLKRPEPALFHARRCLDQCKEASIQDFDLAYACQALARASAVAGRRDDSKRYIVRAREAGETIKKKEDRDLLFNDLKTIPAYSD